MKDARLLNRLTTLTLIAAGVVVVCYVIVLLFPQIPLNPFRPESITLVETPEEVAAAKLALPKRSRYVPPYVPVVETAKVPLS